VRTVPAAIRQQERVAIVLVMEWFVLPANCVKMVIASPVKADRAEVAEVLEREAVVRRAHHRAVRERVVRVAKALAASGVCRRAVVVVHVKWQRPNPSMVWRGYWERWA